LCFRRGALCRSRFNNQQKLKKVLGKLFSINCASDAALSAGLCAAVLVARWSERALGYEQPHVIYQRWRWG
jgi:hypothetical protein